jgi:cytochrome c553
MKSILLTAGTALAFFLLSPAMAQPAPATVQACDRCHGGGDAPRLNGQRAGYILARLKYFAGAAGRGRHGTFDMAGALAALDDAGRRDLARHYDSLPPTEPRPGPLAALGERIYTKGIQARKVLACTLCHGARAEGHDDTPRLAGQHADYLKRQMSLFGLNWRRNALMHDNTQELTGAQIDALASYLAND